MSTPYQNIAKAALMNWNGLSEEEANQKIQTESIEELEKEVYAMGSVKYAVIGIAKITNLDSEQTTSFFNAVVRGPENAEIFEIVKNKIQGLTESQKLEILSVIHDGWVIDNSSEKTFNKKKDKKQLRQYTPLDLIGWNEVKSDLLFLTPILSSVNIEVNEKDLSSEYHIRVSNYMEKMSINSKEDLIELVKQGKKYYSSLPEDLEERLSTMSEVIANELIDNWNNKDPETSQIFNDRNNQKRL